MQKLIDTYGRQHDYLRISLTEKCNLRCTYCMPEYGVKPIPSPHKMRANEVFEIARTFVEMGVEKIRLTGGEPLLRNDFDTIARKLSMLNTSISLSTNAVLADTYLDTFRDARIQDLNISLDSLKPDRFKHITRKNAFDRTINGKTEDTPLLL